MTIKLFNIAKELNVGVGSLSEFLKTKSFEIEENNPNARVGIKELDLLMNEFGKSLSKDEYERIYNKFAKPKSEKKAPVKAEKKPEEENTKNNEAAQHIPTVVPEIGLTIKGTIEEKKKEANPASEKPELKEKKETAAPKEKVEKPVAAEQPETPSSEKVAVAEKKSEPKPEPKEAIKEKPEPKKIEEVKPEVKPTAKVETQAEVANTEAKSVAKPEQAKATTEVLSESKQEEKPKTEKKEKEQAADLPKPTAKTTETITTNEEKKEEKKSGGVYRIDISAKEPQVTVVGTIDLDAINSNTRPRKKTKEDKQREQENKKKRKRISTAAVDVNKVGAKVGTDQTRRPANPQARQGGAPQGGGRAAQGGGRKQNRRNPVPKAELSDEEIQKQVKETLARLTTKRTETSLGRRAKYRRDRRDAISKATQEARELRSEQASILKITEFVTVSELAIMMDVPVNEVIGTCMGIGLMVGINQRLEAETIDMIAEEFGFETEFVSADVVEAIGEEEVDSEEDLEPRQAVVTVMGHVDHGKSSLLDYLRKSNVIAGEAGGITQHLGAYVVKLKSGRKLTMLDTPGHEAFTAMRARGAKVADIAIVIIAANDRVMPQTEEAINHATAAGVPIVFAINKIDTTGANPEKIKEQLANLNFLVEDWGGKYQCQEISAKHGNNIDELLEKIMLEADLLDLKANPDRNAAGTVLQSSLDKGRGYVSKVLVQNGTLNVGDFLLAGNFYGRVRAMYNEHDKRVKSAGPSTPVLVLGLNGAPSEGDSFNVMDTEHEAKEIAQRREQLQREQQLRTHRILTLEDISHRRSIGNFQELNLIVKGDVGGSVEALSDSLIKLSTEEIQVNVIHKGVGEISQSDIVLASASNAVVIGFQVRPSVDARRLAESEGVEIRSYSIIYDTINEVKAAMEGMLAPEIREEVTATLEVLQVFKITKVGTIAGCLVKEGKIKRNNKVRLIRNGIVIHSGELGSLKRFKDDAKEVVSGLECGLDIKNYDDIVEGDIIESYEEIEIKKKL